MEVCEIMTTLRKENNLTQKEIAEKIGVGQATICLWESGASLPNCTAIKKMCEFYDISADFFVGIVDENGNGSTKYRNIPPQKQLFLDMFDKMTREQRALLFSLMREMLK
ncbi:MAG: helix-turn-helix transcriptional regulator [Clostridia bacterium]